MILPSCTCPWWWSIGALMVGAVVGMFVMALCVMAGRADEMMDKQGRGKQS